MFIKFLVAATLQIGSFESQAEALRQELGIEVVDQIPENTTRIHLINQGDTDWLAIKRLQGHLNVPLNEEGMMQAELLSQILTDVPLTAFYSSDLQNAAELAEILSAAHNLPLTLNAALRGENHGAFNGLIPDEYQSHPYYLSHEQMTAAEELFRAWGYEGESKEQVARRAVPAIVAMAAVHPGEEIAIVSHGGFFKVLNYYLSGEIVSIPHGTEIIVYSDGARLYLKK